MLNPGIREARNIGFNSGWRRAAHSPHALDVIWHCALRSPVHVSDEACDLEAVVIHTLPESRCRHPRPHHETTEPCRLCACTKKLEPMLQYAQQKLEPRTVTSGNEQVGRHLFPQASATVHIPSHLHAKP